MRYVQTGVVLVLFLGLVSCGAPANSPTSYTPALAPDVAGCGGQDGVKVRPCPATLTKKRSTVDVTVSGPNVVSSAIKTNSKNQSGCGNVCDVGSYSSDYLKYAVSPGSKCGTAELYFYGYNASGGTVGIGKLKVVNKDCG